MPTLDDLSAALADSGATFHVSRSERNIMTGAIGLVSISGPNSLGETSTYCVEMLFDRDEINAYALRSAKTWADYARSVTSR